MKIMKVCHIKPNELGTLVVLTGHVDGKLVRWENMVPVKVATKCSSSVVEMSMIKSNIVVATLKGTIEIWNYNFSKMLKRIDITTFSFKLMNYYIKNIVVTPHSIYFNTYGGDFIKTKYMITTDKSGEMQLNYRVGGC